MLLHDIKFIDLNASVLDDGELGQLKKTYGELKVKLKRAKRVKGQPTEDQTKTIAKLEKEVEAASKAVEKAKKEFDKELATWKKTGRYKFKRKVYVDYTGTRAPRPEHYLQWCRYDERNNYREFRSWRAQWGHSEVKESDPYLPEGLEPDVSGNYIYGDCILTKVDLRQYLLRRYENIKRSERATKDKIDKFKHDVEAEGGDVPDSVINEIVGGIH